MARLIRMDGSGHATLAEWHAEDRAAFEAAARALREELEAGSYAVVSGGAGEAAQITELPREAELVIVRRPIAGG